MGDLSEHFSSREFACHDGSTHEIDPRLIELLEIVRDHFERPIAIVSGYRSPSWNKRVGGATGSFHVKGMAADIKIPGVAPADIYRFCDARFPLCGLGLYRTWIHLDCRQSKARWGGPVPRPLARSVVRPFALGDAAAIGGIVTSTKWIIARALAEIAVRWAWKALRDWRVSPEELLDLADELIDYARARRREAGSGQ